MVRGNDTGSAVAFALVLGTWLALTATEVSFPFVPLLPTHSPSAWPELRSRVTLAVYPIYEHLLWVSYFT